MNGHTMDTTQPVRGNEILPCAAMWMDLASTVLSEMSKIETKTVTHHLSVESKQTSSEHGKAETDPQTQGNKLVVTSKEGRGEGQDRDKGSKTQTTLHNMATRICCVAQGIKVSILS